MYKNDTRVSDKIQAHIYLNKKLYEEKFQRYVYLETFYNRYDVLFYM